MRQQGFEDDQHLQFLQTATLIRRRRALVVAVLSALAILLITAGLSVAACSYGFLRIGIALGTVGLLGGIVVGFRVFQSRSSHTQEIAQRADGHWKTTGRFAALWEVYQKPTLLQRKEKFDLISSQLSNVGRNFSVKELLDDTPLLYPVLFTLCAFLFFLGALLYRPAQTLSPAQARRAEMKEELSMLLESAPAMPRVIEKKLESLQASLEDSTLSDEEVIDQINEVLIDVSTASELYRELEQSRTEKEPIIQEQEPAAEQQESQAPPEEPEEKPEQQEESSSRNSQSEEGKGEDGKQDSQGEGGEYGEEISPNESQDQESGNSDAQQAGDEGADGGKQGAGEGEGAQGEQSNGASGSGAGDENNSETSSSEGNSDSGEGSGEAQGKEPQGEGASSESSSDSTSSEPSPGAPSESSQSNAQAQSLEQAAQVLEGMKEQLQSEQGRDGTSNEAHDQGQSDTKEGEDNKPSDRGNGDSREDSETNKGSNNAREQDDSSSSDSQESSSEKGDASDTERGSEAEDGSRPEQQLGEQSDDNVAQGASVGEGEPLRREIEGEGEGGFQEGSFGFEDKQIGSLQEKVDSQYAESTGKFSRNEEAASSLREIQEVDLAPPTVRDRPQQQRIPPEYRDILKQR